MGAGVGETEFNEVFVFIPNTDDATWTRNGAADYVITSSDPPLSDNTEDDQNIYTIDGTITENRQLTVPAANVFTIQSDDSERTWSMGTATGTFQYTDGASANAIRTQTQAAITELVTNGTASAFLSVTPTIVQLVSIDGGTGILSLNADGVNLVIPAGDEININADPGTAGQYIASNGPGNPPTWEDVGTEALVTARNDAKFALPEGVFTAMPFELTDDETNIPVLEHDNGDNTRIVSHTTGNLLFNVKIQVDDGDADTNNVVLEMELRKNGVLVDGSESFTTVFDDGSIPGGEHKDGIMLSMVVPAVPDDFFQVFVLKDTLGGGVNGIDTESGAIFQSLLTGAGPAGPQGPAGGGSTIVVEDEGIVVPGGPHGTLNFVGTSVTVTDAGGGEATVTVTGGGGGGSTNNPLALTDNAIVRGDVAADDVQTSGVIIDDLDAVTGMTQLTVVGSGAAHRLIVQNTLLSGELFQFLNHLGNTVFELNAGGAGQGIFRMNDELGNNVFEIEDDTGAVFQLFHTGDVTGPVGPQALYAATIRNTTGDGGANPRHGLFISAGDSAGDIPFQIQDADMSLTLLTVDDGGQLTINERVVAGTPTAFRAVDTVGGQVLGAAFVTHVFDAPLLSQPAGLFTEAVANEFTISEAGEYIVSFWTSTFISVGNARSQSESKLQVDTGGGFVDVPGTLVQMYNREVLEGKATGAASFPITVAAGDVFRVQVRRSSGAGSVQTFADGSGIAFWRAC